MNTHHHFQLRPLTPEELQKLKAINFTKPLNAPGATEEARLALKRAEKPSTLANVLAVVLALCLFLPAVLSAVLAGVALIIAITMRVLWLLIKPLTRRR